MDGPVLEPCCWLVLDEPLLLTAVVVLVVVGTVAALLADPDELLLDPEIRLALLPFDWLLVEEPLSDVCCWLLEDPLLLFCCCWSPEGPDDDDDVVVADEAEWEVCELGPCEVESKDFVPPVVVEEELLRFELAPDELVSFPLTV